MSGPIVSIVLRGIGRGVGHDDWVLDDPGGPLDALGAGPVLGALASAMVPFGSVTGQRLRILLSAHAFAGHSALLVRDSEDGSLPRYRCDECCAAGPIPEAVLAALGHVEPRLYCAVEPHAP